MAILVKSKLKELIKTGKADPNVQVEYDDLEEKYKLSRDRYRDAREELENAKERLKRAREIKKDIPIMQRSKIKRTIRTLEAKVEVKQAKYEKARESYKKRLKAFRALKRIIRQQSRACKAYESFFAAISDAERLGIDIPRYIRIEETKHKATYRRARFSIDKNGITEIEMPDIESASDLRSLIHEKKTEARREKVQKMIETTKSILESGTER